ncbi:nuclear pore complex protein Nup214 isoform X2 [Hyalella azteca]|uniref:Nuclear pore complex protein Nup214 isoform X2 n=1 Tax=Hyalella azteca TaxID=294128 RepID=A0A8B7P776_HYAAZ|nr:nuclear pore complex protein Nup214 isoform X2 [Hyalella azteca]
MNEPPDVIDAGNQYKIIAEALPLCSSDELPTVPPGERPSLVDAVSSFGLLLVAKAGTLIVKRTSALVDSLSGGDGGVEVWCGGRITHVTHTCDSLSVLVITIWDDDCPHMLLFDTATLIQQGCNARPYLECTNSSSVGSRVLALAVNPTDPACVAYCTSTGDLTVINISSDSVNYNTKNNVGASALGWSAKGKQICVGCMNGMLSLYKPDLTPVRSIPPPTLDVTPAPITALVWFTNTEFFVCYSQNSQTCLVYVNGPKGQQAQYINYEDVCFSMDSEEPLFYHLIFVPQWNQLLVLSSGGIEMATLMKSADGSWSQLSLDEGSRAEMHFINVTQETFPLGMTLDLASKKTFTVKEDVTEGPFPMVVSLSTGGELNFFYLCNKFAGAPDLLAGFTQQAVTGPVRTPQQYRSNIVIPARNPAQTTTSVDARQSSDATSVTFGAMSSAFGGIGSASNTLGTSAASAGFLPGSSVASDFTAVSAPVTGIVAAVGGSTSSAPVFSTGGGLFSDSAAPKNRTSSLFGGSSLFGDKGSSSTPSSSFFGGSSSLFGGTATKSNPPLTSPAPTSAKSTFGGGDPASSFSFAVGASAFSVPASQPSGAPSPSPGLNPAGSKGFFSTPAAVPASQSILSSQPLPATPSTPRLSVTSNTVGISAGSISSSTAGGVSSSTAGGVSSSTAGGVSSSTAGSAASTFAAVTSASVMRPTAATSRASGAVVQQATAGCSNRSVTHEAAILAQCIKEQDLFEAELHDHFAMCEQNQYKGGWQQYDAVQEALQSCSRELDDRQQEVSGVSDSVANLHHEILEFYSAFETVKAAVQQLKDPRCASVSEWRGLDRNSERQLQQLRDQMLYIKRELPYANATLDSLPTTATSSTRQRRAIDDRGGATKVYRAVQLNHTARVSCERQLDQLASKLKKLSVLGGQFPLKPPAKPSGRYGISDASLLVDEDKENLSTDLTAEKQQQLWTFLQRRGNTPVRKSGEAAVTPYTARGVIASKSATPLQPRQLHTPETSLMSLSFGPTKCSTPAGADAASKQQPSAKLNFGSSQSSVLRQPNVVAVGIPGVTVKAEPTVAQVSASPKYEDITPPGTPENGHDGRDLEKNDRPVTSSNPLSALSSLVGKVPPSFNMSEIPQVSHGQLPETPKNSNIGGNFSAFASVKPGLNFNSNSGNESKNVFGTSFLQQPSVGFSSSLSTTSSTTVTTSMPCNVSPASTSIPATSTTALFSANVSGGGNRLGENSESSGFFKLEGGEATLFKSTPVSLTTTASTVASHPSDISSSSNTVMFGGSLFGSNNSKTSLFTSTGAVTSLLKSVSSPSPFGGTLPKNSNHPLLTTGGETSSLTLTPVDPTSQATTAVKTQDFSKLSVSITPVSEVTNPADSASSSSSSADAAASTQLSAVASSAPSFAICSITSSTSKDLTETSSTGIVTASQPSTPKMSGFGATFSTSGSSTLFGALTSMPSTNVSQSGASQPSASSAATSSVFNSTPSVAGSAASALGLSSSSNLPKFTAFPPTSSSSTAGVTSGSLFKPATPSSPTVLNVPQTSFSVSSAHSAFSLQSSTSSAVGIPSSMASLFGATASGGVTITTSTSVLVPSSTSAFGSPLSSVSASGTASNASGVTTAFSSVNSLFKSPETSSSVIATTTGTSAFGAKVTSPTSLFGTPSASVFGAPASSATSLFSAPSSTNSLFGTAISSSNSPFGALPTTSSSIFSSPAPSSSVFGQPPATSSSVFGASASTSGSVFGAPATSSSVFGASASTSGSVFGAPATSSSVFGATASNSGSIFGTPASSAAPLFGSTASSSGSAFGAPASSGSLFGAQASSGGSVFGAPVSSSSVFGTQVSSSGSVFGTNSSSGSVFEAPSSTASVFGAASPSVFGSSSASGSVFGTGSVFGAKPAVSAGSVFGGGGSAFGVGGSVFGGAAPATSSASVFGGAPSVGAFGSASNTGGSVFGGGASFGASSSSVFGGSSSSSGGASSSIFGGGAILSGLGSSTPANPPSKNVFGISSSAVKPQTDLFGGSGGVASPSVFGSASASPLSKPASAFGAAPTFGSPPKFGASPAFGSPPAFGGSVFGGNSAAAGSSGATGGFSSFANATGTATFGGLAASGNNSAFGSSSNSNSPFASGGSSFTSWR